MTQSVVFCYTSPNGLSQGIGGLAEFSFFAVSFFCYSPIHYGSSRTKKAGRVPETTLDTDRVVRRKLDHSDSIMSGVRSVPGLSARLSSGGGLLFELEQVGIMSACDKLKADQLTGWLSGSLASFSLRNFLKDHGCGYKVHHSLRSRRRSV